MEKCDIGYFPPNQILSQRLFNLISALDMYFIPTISSRTSIVDYAEKLGKNADIFVVCDFNQDVGLCAIYTNKPVFAYITAIGVLPHMARRGLGRRLINKSIDLCRSKKMQKIGLEVWPTNIPALSLYEKMGFSLVEYRGDSLYMEYTLFQDREESNT